MKKVYDTFLDDPSSLPQGEAVELLIRNLTPGKEKYDTIRVKAVVSRDPAQLAEGDVLWLRWTRGSLQKEPWAIKIIEELDLIKAGTLDILAMGTPFLTSKEAPR